MRMILAAAAMAAAVGAAGVASATTFSGTYNVTAYSSESNGLQIDLDDGSGGFTRTGLDFGESQTFNLFGIEAGEDIDAGTTDGNAKSISVSFTFQNPTNFVGGGPDATVGGTTVAMDGNWWQGGDYGQLTWGAPATVNFGNYGVLTITMLPTTFGEDHHADVKAKFSLAAPSVAGVGGVPEPATWGMMIMGFGLAGATIRRRRTVVAAA